MRNTITRLTLALLIGTCIALTGCEDDPDSESSNSSSSRGPSIDTVYKSNLHFVPTWASTGSMPEWWLVLRPTGQSSYGRNANGQYNIRSWWYDGSSGLDLTYYIGGTEQYTLSGGSFTYSATDSSGLDVTARGNYYVE